MECFISTKLGTYDYPGGEIISWISQNNDVYIVCDRMDDREYGKTEYVNIHFINCEVIKNEFDMNISPYEKLGSIHSNINLCLDEDGIEAGKDKNCRFNFFIKDENEIPHDFILECDDVKLEYLEKWK